MFCINWSRNFHDSHDIDHLTNFTSMPEFKTTNMQIVLPQLRSVTSKELGCDPRGFSRAGKDTKIWYCVVLVGRYSKELNEMREVSSFF
ncbi:hypothetical protein H5410_018363 [Solanum commersonii]|uniref:Uncharacterized protein n=1 Tax=Solanum commersonii TaxID=4109 RepID=A0A9J6A2M8_SOLCO|nr:hypothetical protein H5410_018363 [Solanum commersonii]